MMGKMKEFAQDVAEAMGSKEITASTLEVGQEVLDANRDPFWLMKIAKWIRQRRFIHVCAWCKRFKSGDEWVEGILKADGSIIYPQGKQTHVICQECFEIEMLKLKAV